MGLEAHIYNILNQTADQGADDTVIETQDMNPSSGGGAFTYYFKMLQGY